MTGPDLSADERALLDFAGTFWHHQGAKEQAIRDTFGITPTRYYQRLNALLDRPEALAYAPTTVRRLLRLRLSRGSRRAG